MKSIVVIIVSILCVVAIATSGTRSIQPAYGAVSISLAGAKDGSLGAVPVVPMCDGQTVDKYQLVPACDAADFGGGRDAGGGGMVAGTVVDAVAAAVTAAAGAAAGAAAAAATSSAGPGAVAAAAGAAAATAAAAVGLDAALHELNQYSQQSEPSHLVDTLFDSH